MAAKKKNTPFDFEIPEGEEITQETLDELSNGKGDDENE